ncbi:Crp/Fnr family transcriptional regulator [Pedobacter frigoris]|uniref:Crp/Fnr family transcriptional regulator n=1 Tax=Pedobacter frigoris TaxID=2571272 RepID=UPI002931C5F3|nr:Crp/Fnr family transcriptional regulator [Pedobacter frigoris]
MLNNRKTFEKLMTLLRNIYPDVPLPEGFEEFLWIRMTVEPLYKKDKILEFQGEKPKNAYYVVSGLVTVHGYLDAVPFTESIYRENTIVALNAFMKREDAAHTITATKGTLVWSISHTAMEEIYKEWPPLKALALQTALNYLEMKKERRSSFLAMLAEDRVLEFYKAFKGLLPVRSSPIKDVDIASYLSTSLKSLRRNRGKL